MPGGCGFDFRPSNTKDLTIVLAALSLGAVELRVKTGQPSVSIM